MSTVSVSTTAAKHGNVLVLLNTLYTSGFASVSATIPMLTSKTMHTLYATSFLIYSLNCIFNWFHTYCILNGYVTSFPLRIWFIVSVVVVAVSGSMLCVLLVMLCVENAFAHRLDITPYKSGLAVIWEAFLEWVHSFNNFRVAFLFMILHDAPITLSNFFLLASCRCAGPNVLHWPLFVSALSISVSLMWRLVMLYFAYRRLIFPSRSQRNVLPVSGGTSSPGDIKKHSRSNSSFRSAGRYGVPIVSLSDGPRLNETDETWPIRWASVKVYGEYPKQKSRYQTVLLPEAGRHEVHGCCSPKHTCAYVFSYLLIKICDLTGAFARRLAFLALVLTAYACGMLLCCLPCMYFYSCRKNSFAHRHKCSKNCVRKCTFAFHYAALAFSLIVVLVLLTLNVLLMDSVHIFGANNFPPEINTICLSVDPEQRLIRPFMRSASPFDIWRQLWRRTSTRIAIGVTAQSAADRQNELLLCKPIWEDADVDGAGAWRRAAGPWQTRIALDDTKLLAISTHFTSDYDSRNMPTANLFEEIGPLHTLYYDFALLTKIPNDPSNTTVPRRYLQCSKRAQSRWHFLKSLERMGFPYFIACTSTIRLRSADLIDCRHMI